MTEDYPTDSVCTTMEFAIAENDSVGECTVRHLSTSAISTPQPMDSSEQFEERDDISNIINIAVVGPSRVGKTTLISTFINNKPFIPSSPSLSDDEDVDDYSDDEGLIPKPRKPEKNVYGAVLSRCKTQISDLEYTLNILDCSSLADAKNHFDLSNVDAFIMCFSANMSEESISYAESFDLTKISSNPVAVVMSARLKSDCEIPHDLVGRVALKSIRNGGEYIDDCSARSVQSVRRLFAQTVTKIFAARQKHTESLSERSNSPEPVVPDAFGSPTAVDANGKSIFDEQYTFKVVLIGDPRTGKSSMMKRLVDDEGPSFYTATVGIDLGVMYYNVDPFTSARLQLWDVGGQERFGTRMNIYYTQCNGAFLVFDQTRPATFTALQRWLDSLRAVCMDDIPVLVVSQKSDCESSVPTEDIMQFVAKNKLLGFSCCSAYTDRGCDEALEKLVRAMVEYARANHFEALRKPVSPEVVAENERIRLQKQNEPSGPALFTSWRL